MFQRPKITIVGAGNVGASCAAWVAEKDLGDVVLLDIPAAKDMPKGKALDLLQVGPISGYNTHLVGTTDYADTANSDICVITAGMPRARSARAAARPDCPAPTTTTGAAELRPGSRLMLVLMHRCVSIILTFVNIMRRPGRSSDRRGRVHARGLRLSCALRRQAVRHRRSALRPTRGDRRSAFQARDA